MQFTILHADDQVIVVNKDAGLLTTPAHGEESLIDRLNARFFGRHPVAPVHRLDRGTSGLLVFARSPSVARHLARQFARHTTEREYIAVVAGCVPSPSGSIDLPLDGKQSLTHFRVLRADSDHSVLALRLATGRRNQIRLHAAAMGHPVLGDRRIGGDAAAHPAWPHDRIALHAKVLGFHHPALGRTLRFDSELPPPFAALMGTGSAPGGQPVEFTDV